MALKSSQKLKFKGKLYLVGKPTRKGKQLSVKLPSGKVVNFGDPSMPEFPGTMRGDNYCARSFGIKGKNNPESANFWSRKYLWNCVGKKSKKSRKEAGLFME